MAKNNKFSGKHKNNKARTKCVNKVDESITTPKESYNDASWYAANAQILKDSASLAFSTPQGGYIDVEGRPHRIPGIMRLDLLCTPGLSKDATSAVNIAARNVYSYVRHANAGHANYESPDLMMYLIAMDQAYAYYSWMRRIYGLSRTYFQKNRYIPKWLIESMDVDYEDLLQNLSDFRLYINTYAQKVGSLVTPSGMTYFQRHSWVFSNIFADSTTAKAQFVYFNPSEIGVYEGFTDRKGGKVVYKPLVPNGTKFKLNDFITFGNSILEPLLRDEDINIMSGDIMKAFGDNVNKLAIVSEEETLLPVYNAEVLTQIQNARLGKWTSGSEVTQTNGHIVYKPTYTKSSYENPDRARLFNMPYDSVEASDVMVASRLIYTVTSTGEPTSFGTELFTALKVFGLSDDGSALAKITEVVDNLTISVNGAQTSWLGVQNTMKTVAALQVFNFHPYVNCFAKSGVGDEATQVDAWTFGDVENYTTINNSDIEQMNEVAILNEFDVPQMGVYR